MEEVLTRKEVNALVSLLSHNYQRSWYIYPKLLASLADRGFLTAQPVRRMDDSHKKVYSLSHKGRARLGLIESTPKRKYWLTDVQIRTLVHLLNGAFVRMSDRDAVYLVVEGLISWTGLDPQLTQYGRDFLLKGERRKTDVIEMINRIFRWVESC